MGFTCPHSCLQNPSLPFLPILLHFPCCLVSVSVKFNRVQANESYSIPCIFHTEQLGYSTVIIERHSENCTKFCVQFLTQLHRTLLFPDSHLWVWVEAEDFQHLFKMSELLTGHVAIPGASIWLIQTSSTAHEKGLLCAWDLFGLLYVD